MADARMIRIELDGFPEDQFEVASFSGSESLSQLFSFTVSLASSEPINNFDDLLEAKAHLIFGVPEVHIHGMLCSAQQGYDSAWKAGSGQLTRVDVVLVPELWKATLNVQTKFFRKMNVEDIITQILGDHGLEGKFDLSGNHPKRDSVLQYQESDLDFIQRLLEHEGIHYQFIHEEGHEMLVFADGNSAFQTILDASELPLRSGKVLEGQSNIGPWGEEKTIRRFQSRQRFVPNKVILQDYNEQTPATDLKVVAEDGGKAAKGIQFFYAENYKDADEGGALGDLRKEEILARKRLFYGASNAYRLYAGGVFKVVETDSIDPELGQEYVVTEIQSEGTQPTDLTSGRGFSYANSFTCIPVSVVYRPPIRTPWPVMPPLVHAKIIASGDYANLEEQGRYEVQFLFDIDKAGSIPVRLMESYVGIGYGIHAPLHEGVEVLVGFENGDPDRPIIVSAAYNKEYTNPVVDANHAQSVFRSAGNNELRFDDTKGSEHVFLHGTKDWQIAIENDKTQNVGHDEKMDIGNDRTKTVGHDQKVKIGNDKTTDVGANHTEKIGADQEITIGANKTEDVNTNSTETVGASKKVDVKALYQTTVGAAMNTTVGAAKAVEVKGPLKYVVGGSSTQDVKGEKKITVSKDFVTNVNGACTASVNKVYGVVAKETVSIESDKDIVIKTGKASITMKKDGTIVIEGKDIQIKGSGEIVAKASKDMTLKGKNILQN